MFRDFSKPFQIVNVFDPARYMGKWYQIARFPIDNDENCVGNCEHYEFINSREIEVEKSCYRGQVGGQIARSLGRARLEETGVFSITYDEEYPTQPNYYVLAIHGDYDIAVIGCPDGSFGAINARKPQISEKDYQWAKSVLGASGYDVSTLHKTPQIRAF